MPHLNMTTLRNWLWGALSLALAQVALASTDISDVPMAVKNNVPPNLMFMIDRSGSVSNIVPEAPFDPTTNYLSCPSSRVVSGGFNDPLAPGSTTYDIYIRSNGQTKFGSGGRDGSNYTFGTSSGQYCFDRTKYYNFRLNADTFNTDCDTFANGADCKYPGTGYLDAVYSGNYLNWYFGAASSYSSAALLDYANGRKAGTKSRIEIAKEAANATLDTLPLPVSGGNAKARVGLSSYNGSDGGSLIQAMGDLTSTKRSSMQTSINALAPSGATPLAETLADIGHYFTLPYTGNLTIHPDTSAESASVAELFRQGSTTPHRLSGVNSSTAAPIQYWCQRSYAILLTDGRPQNDQALSSNTYLCDYDGDVAGACSTSGSQAYDRKTTSTNTTGSGHTGHLGAIHGYESAGSDYLDDVAQALFETDLRPDMTAPPGRAKKNNVRTYTVGFADAQAINDALLQEAAAQGGGLFLTAEDTSSLTSALKKAVDDALAKDGASAAVAVVNTQITVDNTAYASSYNSGTWTGDLESFALDTSTGLPIEPHIWSAQAKLDARTASNRNIVTYNGTTGAVFTSGSSGLDADLVAYIRGDRSMEGTTYRKRAHLLGDIVNAEPVVVKYDKPIVFQAANDGMLHVFNGSVSASDSQRGEELWAYVPRLLHSRLEGFADPNYTHEYYLDATPVVADVGGTKILVGGLGKGGRGYYALDITSYSAANENQYANKVLWEKLVGNGTDGYMGYGFGTPLVVKAPSGDWVVLVASGYNNGSDISGDGRGKVFALDALTGALLHVIDTGVGNASASSGLVHLGKLSTLGPNDIVNYVYGGDLFGNVWRFDLTSWSATKIAVLTDSGGNYQPITVAPAVGPVAGSTTKQFVYLGTGQYLGDSDVPGNTPVNAHATQTQSAYGIIDETLTASPALPNIRGTNGSSCPADGGDGDLLCMDTGTISNGESTNAYYPMQAGQSGWYFDIPVANGRVVTHPQLTSGGTLAFTINVPTNAACDPGGSSWIVRVDARNGGAIQKALGVDEYYSSFIFLDNALASRPVVVETADGKVGVIRMSSKEFKAIEIPEPPGGGGGSGGPTWYRIYWRILE